MRKNYIDWDQYFMGISLMSAMRSKDPSTQVGACIVNGDHKIVGIGYNGFPNGVSDTDFPWEREGDFLDTKYPYVVHAEQNAILNSTTRLNGCRIYVSLFPCHECAKTIIQSGIREVIYVSDKYHDTPSIKASKKMMEAAKVACRQMEPMELTMQIGDSTHSSQK
ncbi:MAG: dCMP deaminase family protein [Turicibacter sp.]|nr:dCMP deaminase family protein [Turicibacter sp.]